MKRLAPSISVLNKSRSYRVQPKRIAHITHTIFRALSLQNVELAIAFVGERKIQKLNRQFRGKNRPTDVLSFPQQTFPKPLSVGKTHRIMGPLGDLAICVKIAEKNARAIGQGLDREVAFLLCHGILHLCGHDHMRPADEKRMLAEQRLIMKKIERKAGQWRNCVTKLRGRRP